jgi:UDP-N-acetylglucosamine 2-epimerase (non-hydrolysing)
VTKFFFTIGTSAELLKVFTVASQLDAESFQIVSTDQQSNLEELSLSLGMPAPYSLHNGSAGSLTSLKGALAWVASTVLLLSKFLRNRASTDKDWVVVHGDTITSTLCALVAKLKGYRIAHIEAGYRSGNLFRPFPEEIDRRITAYLADIHFAPTREAVQALHKRRGVVVFTYGNTALDGVEYAQNHMSIAEKHPEPFGVVFIHRTELIGNRARLTSTIAELLEASATVKFVFVLDPVTRHNLEKFGLLSSLEESSIQLEDKLPFLEFHALLAQAEFLITDSGGQQVEASALGLPCLVVRRETESIEPPGSSVVISRLQPRSIIEFVSSYKQKIRRRPETSQSPSKAIADYLRSLT